MEDKLIEIQHSEKRKAFNHINKNVKCEKVSEKGNIATKKRNRKKLRYVEIIEENKEKDQKMNKKSKQHEENIHFILLKNVCENQKKERKKDENVNISKKNKIKEKSSYNGEKLLLEKFLNENNVMSILVEDSLKNVDKNEKLEDLNNLINEINGKYKEEQKIKNIANNKTSKQLTGCKIKSSCEYNKRINSKGNLNKSNNDVENNSDDTNVQYIRRHNYNTESNKKEKFFFNSVCNIKKSFNVLKKSKYEGTRNKYIKRNSQENKSNEIKKGKKTNEDKIENFIINNNMKKKSLLNRKVEILNSSKHSSVWSKKRIKSLLNLCGKDAIKQENPYFKKITTIKKKIKVAKPKNLLLEKSKNTNDKSYTTSSKTNTKKLNKEKDENLSSLIRKNKIEGMKKVISENDLNVYVSSDSLSQSSLAINKNFENTIIITDNKSNSDIMLQNEISKNNNIKTRASRMNSFSLLTNNLPFFYLPSKKVHIKNENTHRNPLVSRVYEMSNGMFMYKFKPYDETYALFSRSLNIYEMYSAAKKELQKSRILKNKIMEKETKDKLKNLVKPTGRSPIVALPQKPILLVSQEFNIDKWISLFYSPNPCKTFYDKDSGLVCMLESRDPCMWSIKGVMKDKEYQQIGSLFQDFDKNYEWFSSAVGGNSFDEDPYERNSMSVRFKSTVSYVIPLIRRISLLTGHPIDHFEDIQAVKYDHNKACYKMHHDSIFHYGPSSCLSENASRLDKFLYGEMKFEENDLLHFEVIDENGNVVETHFDYFIGGQVGKKSQYRMTTCLIYMNTIPNEYGGHTSFPWLLDRGTDEINEQGVLISPSINSALIWANCIPNQEGLLVPDPRTIHSAEKLTKGVKVVMNVWMNNMPHNAGKGFKKLFLENNPSQLKKKSVITENSLIANHFSLDRTGDESACLYCCGLLNIYNEENKLTATNHIFTNHLNGYYEFHEKTREEKIEDARKQREKDKKYVDLSSKLLLLCENENCVRVSACCISCYNEINHTNFKSVSQFEKLKLQWYCPFCLQLKNESNSKL